MATDTGAKLVGRTAADLAAMVRSGAVKARDVVAASLQQIDALNDHLGAFQRVRGQRALADARDLDARSDLRDLPLAGVPVAIKDLIPVAGEPMRRGSTATPDAPQAVDHEVVRRLRAAGAVVVGITRMPEWGLWGTTDGRFGVTRNPWNLERTPGGSSGGSGAAVAAGMVPIAHGADGLGSIRIPAACSGLFGIKPGPGVVPADVGPSSWKGIIENGILATTIEDAALVLSIMADRDDFFDLRPPPRPLRVALSVKNPLVGGRVDAEMRAVTRATGRLLAGAGHRVRIADPPYSIRASNFALSWWFALAAWDLEAQPEVDRQGLEARTRRHIALGRRVIRLRLARQRDRAWWEGRVAEFFRDFDVLLTPALARAPLRAVEWHRRPWAANVAANVAYAPFGGLWNFARVPAAAVPAGIHSSGVPLSVQLVAPRDGEVVLLSLARQLEELRPWRRHAPLSGLG